MNVTTFRSREGRRIATCLGIAPGAAIPGANPVRRTWAGTADLRGGRSGGPGRRTARARAADAASGAGLDGAEIDGMPRVCPIGTAVRRG